MDLIHIFYINQLLFFFITMLSKLLNSLNNLVDIYISGNNINNELGVSHSRENILLPIGVSIIAKNIKESNTKSDFLSKLRGLLILYIKRIAVYAVIITAIVEVCSFGILSRLAINTRSNTFTTVVIPLGIALLITFIKIFL